MERNQIYFLSERRNVGFRRQTPKLQFPALLHLHKKNTNNKNRVLDFKRFEAAPPVHPTNHNNKRP